MPAKKATEKKTPKADAYQSGDVEFLKSLGLKPVGRAGTKPGANARGLARLAEFDDAMRSAKSKVLIIVPQVDDGKGGWKNPAIPAAVKSVGTVVQTDLSRTQLRTHVMRWVEQNPSFRVVKFDPGFIVKK